MLKALTLFTFLLLSVAGFGQINDLEVDTTWRKGSLLMIDNTIRKGYVKFDRVSSLAAFKRTRDEEEETFLQGKIVAAEIFDGDQLPPRRFARFDVVTGTGNEPLFCEVLMELRDFLVLSYTGLEISTHTTTPTYYNGVSTVTTGPSKPHVQGYSMSETILFASPDGQPAEVILYAPNFRHEGRQMTDLWLKHKPQFYQEKLFHFMQSRQSQVKEYLKEHKIKTVKNGEANQELREEFFELLEFYKSLEEKD